MSEYNGGLFEHVTVGFAEKDNNRGEIFEIEYYKEEIEINISDCRNWIPQKKVTRPTS